MTYTELSRNYRQRGHNISAACPWEIAEALGIHYTGDGNVEHGGMFYSSSHWHYGYADCLQVTVGDGYIFIECGTINKPDAAELDAALRCCDAQHNSLEEIEAVAIYRGVEPAEREVYKLRKSLCGTDFKTARGWISTDHLQGFALATFIDRLTG